MALTLTIQLGETFTVGDHSVKVTKAFSPSDFYVEVEGKEFPVSEDGWIEVTPGVNLRAPYPRMGHRQSGVRVQIDAPDHYVRRSQLKERL